MQEISRFSPPGRHRYKLRKLASRTRDSFSFHEFSLEEITPIIICTSPLGAPCVHRWKLAPGWNAVNAWNRQPAIYQAFFFLLLLLLLFFSSFPNNGSRVSLLPMSMHWLRSNLVTVCKTRRDYLWIYFQRRERRRRSWLVHGIRGE